MQTKRNLKSVKSISVLGQHDGTLDEDVLDILGPRTRTEELMEAPERIWSEHRTCTVDASGATRLLAMDRQFERGTEYIRADIHRAELEALTEALEFYADRDYSGYDVEITDYGLSMTVGEIIKDAGDKARAALAEGETG